MTGAKAKPPVPIWRWALWWFLLAIGIFLFYVLLTPIWIGLRALAWVAEFRARRQTRGERPVSPAGGRGGETPTARR